VVGVGGNKQIEEWWATMPRITKACFVFALGSTLAVTAGAITPLHLWLDWDSIYNNFQIWRLVTNFFFFGKFGMGFIFSMMILYVWVGGGRCTTNRVRQSGQCMRVGSHRDVCSLR